MERIRTGCRHLYAATGSRRKGPNSEPCAYSL